MRDSIRQRVLVVEDYEPLRSAIRSMLESEGYAVLTAVDGNQALQAMAETRPDLILADITMPVMDGYAFYHAVRARREWATIPFIFLTARAEQKDILKGKALGAEDYLTKPFEPWELLVTVGSRLERARAIRETTEAEFDQLKQQIVTILGHELRTPLTYIRGYTDLALEDFPSLSPDLLQEFLLPVKKGADRMTVLVQDLLLLVRLDTGRVAEEFRQLAQTEPDLGAIVESATRQYERQAAEKGVTLEAVVEPDLPPVRLCEPLFVDALGRLVDNAIKFSQGEGKRATVSARAVEGRVEVAVTDEGVGIPAGEIPHLFERFRQIDRETQEQQGVGLGLAIAGELIRLHGGEIEVESVPTEGSIFAIKLPPVEA